MKFYGKGGGPRWNSDGHSQKVWCEQVSRCVGSPELTTPAVGIMPVSRVRLRGEFGIDPQGVINSLKLQTLVASNVCF
jgi:hypothetical protein